MTLNEAFLEAIKPYSKTRKAIQKQFGLHHSTISNWQKRDLNDNYKRKILLYAGYKLETEESWVKK